MNDAHHLSFFAPSLAGGGAERVVVTLANAFAERGHRVDLLLSSKHGPFLSDVDPRVSIVGFGKTHTSLTIPALTQTLRRSQPDLLVSALPGPTVAAHCATARMRLSGPSAPPLCATVHCFPTVDRERADSLRARLLLQAFRTALRRLDTVVGVSEAVTESITRFTGGPRQDLHVLPNPIDTSVPDTDAAHPWFDQSPPVLVAAGRLCPQKDYPTFLRSLAALNARRPVRALILGEGADRAALETLTRELGIVEQTSFLGFVDHPRRFMKQADVFVLPSLFEPFGNVVVEALACGTPVVAASDSGGPPELLAPVTDEYDPFFASGDPSALARTIERTLTTPIRAPRLRERASDFAIPHIVDQYATLFRTILAPN